MKAITTKQLTLQKLEDLQANNNEILDLHINTVQRAFDAILHSDNQMTEAERLALLQDLDWLRGDLNDLRPLDCETLNDNDNE